MELGKPLQWSAVCSEIQSEDTFTLTISTPAIQLRVPIKATLGLTPDTLLAPQDRGEALQHFPFFLFPAPEWQARIGMSLATLLNSRHGGQQ